MNPGLRYVFSGTEQLLMTANVVERLLETFFRRRWMNMAPLAFCCALGLVTVVNQPEKYVSEGILSAAPDTLVANLSNLSLDNSFGTTPAAVASRRINEQLRSDDFALQLASRAGLQPSLDAGLIGPQFVRTRVVAVPDGENLLKVRATTEDPELSFRLATSAIDTFIDWVINDDVIESQTAQSFYEGIAANYLTSVDAAQAALDQYLSANPAPPFGSRPRAEESEIAQLNAELDRATGRYTAALANIEEAKLASELALLDVRQRLRVLDPPTTPTLPTAGLRAMVMTFGVFVALGAGLTLGLVTLTAFLDKTIRTAGDVRSRLGVDLAATIPAVAVRSVGSGS